MRNTILSTILLATIAATMTAQEPGNFAVVNGLKIYYETHGPKGKGPPLEHGRTADNDGLLRYELMAGDVAGLDGTLRSPNRLAVISGTTHYDILATTAVASIVRPFLDAK